MDWLTEGLDKLIIGLLVGGSAGTTVGWKVAVSRQKQVQKAGDQATQTQVGGDSTIRR